MYILFLFLVFESSLVMWQQPPPPPLGGEGVKVFMFVVLRVCLFACLLVCLVSKIKQHKQNTKQTIHK